MTLLGKSFSVIILILSLAFMVLSLAVNASHRNWRDEVEGTGGLKEKIATLQQTNQQLQDSRTSTLNDLYREQVARRTALASLQSELVQLQDQLQESEATVQELRGKTGRLVQLDEARAQALDELTAETKRLREQIRTEQQDRDALFAQSLELTDDMNTLRGFVQTQRERNAQLLKENTRYREVVEAKGIDVNEPLDGSPPDRNGEVLVVQKGLVEVSLGFDDGLREGH
ncbi:MAG: hypothetical protein AAGA03_06050, partial [Planctomycetota bacterium]